MAARRHEVHELRGPHGRRDWRRSARGFDDALFVDADGIVLEGPVTNIWWRVAADLYTPALELGILAGETRAALIELAAELGYAVVEGAFALDDVFATPRRCSRPPPYAR